LAASAYFKNQFCLSVKGNEDYFLKGSEEPSNRLNGKISLEMVVDVLERGTERKKERREREMGTVW
jgi:flagellar basal body L-ring protein FlgH